jgi:YHS domain-containing protein
MKPFLILVALTSCLLVAADKPAEAKPADTGKAVTPKAYPLKVCIVSDNDLDSMGEQASFVYQGQTIKVCCKPCIAKFEKNPAKYLKKLGGK